MKRNFEEEIDGVIGALAHVYVGLGRAREVALLTYSVASISDSTYDGYDGVTTFKVLLEVPPDLYVQIESDVQNLQSEMLNRLRKQVEIYAHTWLFDLLILPQVQQGNDWRRSSAAWLSGEGINNQGRVRSDNVAPLTYEGLLFRSQPEIYLYQALKARGISFAPLPVFLRGGETYRRIEPDFVILSGGVVLVVEVDGDTVHRETPAEAHTRTALLQHEGAQIERISASECSNLENANKAAQKIMATLTKYQRNRP